MTDAASSETAADRACRDTRRLSTAVCARRQASPAWLASFLSALRDAVAVFDENGTLVLANGAFQHLFGSHAAQGWPVDRPTWQQLVGDPIATADGSPVDERGALVLPVFGAEEPVRVTVVRLAVPGDAPLFVALFCRATPSPSSFEAFVAQLSARIRGMRSALERLEEAPPSGLRTAARPALDEERATLARAVIARLRLLSHREQQILAELVNGKRIPSIATALYLSENTVRNYLKRVYRKVGVHSAAELREILTAAPEHLDGVRGHRSPVDAAHGEGPDAAVGGTGPRRAALT